MFLQLFADTERVVKFLHEVGLVGRQRIGLTGVDRGEVTALHLVFLTIDQANTLGVIDVIEHTTIRHLPLRATVIDGSFLLELYDRNSLMHLGCQLAGLVVHTVAWQYHGYELFAGVVLVCFESKRGQWYQVDAVFLDGCEVGISQAQTQHVADTGVVASRGSHPENVVVAPLDIPRVILSEGIHDDVCPRASVVDVAQDMQLVDGKALDDVADSDDEVVSPACRYDGIDDDVHIGRLVMIGKTFVKQLFDDI